MRIKLLMSSLCLSTLLGACGGGNSPPPAAHTTLPTGEALRAEVERVRATNQLPGLSVVIVDKGRIEAVSVGRRNVTRPTLISSTDPFQTGSLTKAATAMMIARLVEQKKLRWDATLGAIFPAWSAQMHPSLREVTLQSLLRHRAGIKRDFELADANELRPRVTGDIRVDRATAGQYFLQQAPALKPDSAYSYSNIGYMIAGLIAETVSGESYQALMQKEVFTPLKITASFGLPEDGGPDAMSGHVLVGNTWQPAQYDADSRLRLQLFDPAGSMMLSMAEYGKLLNEQVLGLQGKSTYLSADTFKLIHTPVDGYGFGWQVGDEPSLGGRISTHSGTILTYLSVTAVVHANGRAVAVSCNCYGDAASEQMGNLLESLLKAKS